MKGVVKENRSQNVHVDVRSLNTGPEAVNFQLVRARTPRALLLAVAQAAAFSQLPSPNHHSPLQLGITVS